MRLILVRHPRPIAAPGLCYGSTDLAVDPGDCRRVLGELQAALPPGTPLYSSPLQRCAVLAAALAATSRAPLRFDPRVAEMDFGDWEMRPWDDIARVEIDAWTADLVHYRPGGGESVLAMATRIGAFRDELRASVHNDVIVICHAGTMRLLAAWQDGLPLADIALKAASASHQIGYGESLTLDC
jgi:alpha-ribazole phosphatase